jgi:hypothetical protein
MWDGTEEVGACKSQISEIESRKHLSSDEFPASILKHFHKSFAGSELPDASESVLLATRQ